MSQNVFDMRVWWKILRRTFKEWIDDDAFQIAAALSFYAIISLAPLVTVSLSAASFFYGEEALRGELVDRINQVVGQDGAEVIETILANAKQKSGGLFGAIGLALLLFGASAVFLQLQKALNTVWNVAPRPDLSWGYTIRMRILSIGLSLGVGLLLLASTSGAAILEYIAANVPGSLLVWKVVNSLLGMMATTGLVVLLFKILPDAVIRWRDALVGALVTAVLFEIGRAALAVYFGRSAPGSAYGASGSLFVLLLWIYYSALILLFGGEFAQAYAGACGVRIRPATHAYRTSIVALPVDDDGRPVIPPGPVDPEGAPAPKVSANDG